MTPFSAGLARRLLPAGPATPRLRLHSPSMSWRDEILAYGRSLGREVHESPLGVGIDFEDGCDAFWILPGEVFSTVEVPPEGPADVPFLLATYEKINHIRDRALHVIRHYLASRGYQIDRPRSGEWPIERDGTLTVLTVDGGLTTLARDTNDIHESVRACLKCSLIKPPSPKRIDRYLNTKGPPLNERPITEDDDEPPSTIAQVLSLMGLCKALDDPQNLTSAQSLRAAAAPTGPMGRMLVRLSERLPEADASVDLASPGVLSLRFADDWASFDIKTRSKTMVRRVRDQGPDSVADQLAEEFLALNAARSAVIRAIRQVASQRGWKQENEHFGATRREVTIEPWEQLTRLLREYEPSEALRRMLPDNPDFAEACVASLSALLPHDQIVVPEVRLMPRDVPDAPPLVVLDHATIAGMDDFARQMIASYMDNPQTLQAYRSPAYDTTIDTWATMADWVRLAERTLQDEWVPPVALLVLLDAGDPRGDEAARRYLAQHEQCDVGIHDIELVWRYRHELPDIAREWFAPQPCYGVPAEFARAALGDPVAQRHIRPEPNWTDDDRDWTAATAKLLPPERQEQLHRALLHWARTEHRWAGPRDEKLRCALELGWLDVAEAMQENPFMLAGLLTQARRSDQFDEPGMLTARDFVLVWSRYAPNEFLARILATAHQTNLTGLAEQAARNAAVGKPDLEGALDLTFRVYESWAKALQPALAIAWTRCRNAGVGAT